MSQRKLSSIRPLVVTVLQRVLLQPFRSHDYGTRIFNERSKIKEVMITYGLNMQDLAYILMLSIKAW